MSAVIVLNTDNTALHTVSVQHAIRMLVREVAIVEEARDGHRIGPYPWPLVLRLIRYVKTTFLYARTPAWSKRGVLRRDHHRCAYCEGVADTVDHLLPQSRGGSNSWQNTVAACTRCNNRKANRTPREAGMTLAWKPSVPTWREAYHRRNWPTPADHLQLITGGLKLGRVPRLDHLVRALAASPGPKTRPRLPPDVLRPHERDVRGTLTSRFVTQERP
jgi:5-methylcytosine-specific restriction endonuclease McrA